ncbi:SIMPL domain-containing protein [Mucilaginibacter sp. Bleaf8]|uniref:SIMPL domain-containing protein n=1 Tax=Mucilaginibacter sp. Bleaf8 TaxID=2834430 RepID=UPI001BD16E57|nr:SIMPL domain-containing protein [Mucilaginibacter sp. Bleaf8]MBS7565945.1 SIMPL domain-containing protein [Mucilaginibacter sp. Bleaf8]
MKKLLMLAAFVTLNFAAFAQTVDLRRKIEVTGNAEQEITPDILYVSISLKEYMDGKNKVDITQLERQLQKAVTEAGVPREDFTINNVSSYNQVVQKKKNPDFLASKQYRIKLHDLNSINTILSKVDDKGIQSTGIDSYDYSKIDQLRRELKIKALLAAREKATYMLSAIGEKVGGAIDIQDVDNEPLAQPVYNTLRFKSAVADEAAPQSDIDFKKIKLNYQVRAVFEIVK